MFNLITFTTVENVKNDKHYRMIQDLSESELVEQITRKQGVGYQAIASIIKDLSRRFTYAIDGKLQSNGPDKQRMVIAFIKNRMKNKALREQLFALGASQGLLANVMILSQKYLSYDGDPLLLLDPGAYEAAFKESSNRLCFESIQSLFILGDPVRSFYQELGKKTLTKASVEEYAHISALAKQYPQAKVLTLKHEGKNIEISCMMTIHQIVSVEPGPNGPMRHFETTFASHVRDPKLQLRSTPDALDALKRGWVLLPKLSALQAIEDQDQDWLLLKQPPILPAFLRGANQASEHLQTVAEQTSLNSQPIRIS